MNYLGQFDYSGNTQCTDIQYRMSIFPSPPMSPNLMSSDKMMDAEEWDADDESSEYTDSLAPFDEFSSILKTLPEPEVLFNYKICRDSHPIPGVIGKSDGWVNTSQLLWELCATLADAGTDVEWTKTFERWRPTWNNIQAQMRSYGYTHYCSEIPVAPIGLAVIRFSEGDRSFEIEQESCGDIQDHLDVWALWRFVIEMPGSEMGVFDVTLIDTA